jgi:hypothetical protein
MTACAAAPWLALAVLIAIFLPLPFIIVAFSLVAFLVVVSRAAPFRQPLIFRLSAAPAAPRSPPF